MSGLRMGVIGCGAMGRHHVRVLAGMDGVQLVGVVDCHVPTVEKLGQIYNVPTFLNHEAFLQTAKPDAVVIATPTQSHEDVACFAMAEGAHVLLEKPMAETTDECLRIMARASLSRRKLMVGHIERFNPAVAAAAGLLRGGHLGRVYQINARRWSQFHGRIRDVGACLTLATHDIDAMRYCLDDEAVQVFAVGTRCSGETDDALSAVLHFRGGAVGVLDVNWITPTKLREFTILGEGGMLTVNCLARELWWHENAKWTVGQASFEGVEEGSVQRLVVQKVEPLEAELAAFVAAVNGETPIPVTGNDGMQAVFVAQAMLESSQLHRAMDLR